MTTTEATTTTTTTPIPSLSEDPAPAAPATSAAAAPASTQPSWRDTLPEDIKGHASLARYKDVAEVAKAYLNAEKMIGAEKIALPGKHATDEDWMQVFRRLGAPEKPEDYKFELPKDSVIDQEMVKNFQAIVHKHGVLPKQAESLLNWYGELSAKRQQEHLTQLKAAQDQDWDLLRKEWGDGLERKAAMARAAVKEYGGDEMSDWLKQTGLDRHPQMLRFMSKMGEQLSEDTIPQGKGSGWGQTPDEIQQKINTIHADRKHPYWDKMHPNHQSAVKEMEDFYKALATKTPKAS